jgi:hypothetical protein
MPSRPPVPRLLVAAGLTVAVALLAPHPTASASPSAAKAIAAAAAGPAATSPSAVTEDRHPDPLPAAAAVVGGATAQAAAAGGEAPAAGGVLAEETGLASFELLGVTLPAAAHPVLVRVHQAGGWGPWHELGFEGDAEGAEAADGPGRAGAHSAPLWVGPSDGYQMLLPPDAGDPTMHVVRAAGAPAAGAGGAQAAAVAAGAPTTAMAYASSPGVISRAAWGARPMRGEPSEASDLRLAIVHHSVSVNGYSAGEVPGMLRSIQAYHMDAHGWSDVGYNFAVDRFGRIWELRQGGILNAVIGGHAQGFNTGSVGVVLLGDHTAAPPTSAAVNAVAEIIAWRFAVAQADPRGAIDYTTVSGSTRYAPGTTVRLNRIASHRDVGTTACPGALAYGLMDTIRLRVASRYAALAGTTLTRWLSSSTHRYSDLEGVALGAPDATAPDEGDLDVYARGGDGQLFVTRWRGQGWSTWSGLGGQLASSPSAVAGPAGASDVFAVGGDGGVWYRTLRDGTWSGWATIGGRFTSAPEVTRTADGRLVVAGRGGDGAVWQRVRGADGRWAPWTTLGGSVRAGAHPGLLAEGDQLTTFVTGADGALWSRTGEVGRPSGWVRVGGQLTSGVSAASDGSGRADVVGRGGDGRLWSVRRVGGRWSAWQQISRERVGDTGGITSWGEGRLDVATITPDGRIFQTWRLEQTGW